MALTVIDLFCGAGGFSEGFRQAGFRVVWGVDRWQPAVDTHKGNHPNCDTLCDDIIRISLLPDVAFHSIVPDSDVIIGSPPCTFFSNSNRSGNGNKSRGKELIKAFLRIVARKKYRRNSILKYWILENVPKASKHIKRKYKAKELGLDRNFTLEVKSKNSKEYNAKYFGVPSNRIRYFCGDFPVPKTVIEHDKDLILLEQILTSLGAPMEKLHQKIKDPLYGFRMHGSSVTDHHYLQQLSAFETRTILRLKQDKGYMGRMAVPENNRKPARTIMATMSFTSRECLVLAMPTNNLRAPTIREVASLMSFPIDYRFYGSSLGIKYKLIGNAVPPKMSFAFAKAILKAENESVVETYPLIGHRNKINFKNLNLDELAIKTEKRKKHTARFKYHIPQFKYDTYRVELTNRHSDFDNLAFKWNVEIHYNQGKDKAKVYTPSLSNIPLTHHDNAKINSFVKLVESKLVNFKEFQLIHCMTMAEISSQKLMGPYEFLNKVKTFIEVEFKSDLAKYISLTSTPRTLPKPIGIGYVLINNCLNKMRNCSGDTLPNVITTSFDKTIETRQRVA
jgi:DNA (cytosine-5)-methyltransferase 1